MLGRALAMLFGIGRVSLADDDGEMQLLQVTEHSYGKGPGDRVLDRIRRITEFGFSSVPPIDSEALLVRRNGERIQSIVIGTSHRPSRPRGLEAGDTCLYDVRGRMVTLGANGIVIDAAGSQVTITNASKVRIEADLLEVTGDVVSRADGASVSLNGLRDAYAAHKHGGVSSGTASTGTTDHPA